VKTAESNDYVLSMSMRASVVKDEIKRMAELYVGRIETQLVQWGKELDELNAHPELDSPAARAMHPTSIVVLESRYRTAQTTLAAWRSLGGVKWGTCKFRVEEAWNNLERAFVDLRTDFAGRGKRVTDIGSAEGIGR